MFAISYGLLWGLSTLTACAVFLLLRQHGQALLKDSSHRADQGPRLNSKISVLTLPTADGQILSFGHRPSGQLVLVTSAGCSVCTEAIASLRQLAARPDTELTLICMGGQADCLRHAEPLPLSVTRVIDQKFATAAHWRIASTPFAIALDAAGYVRGKASSCNPTTLEGLLEIIARPKEADKATASSAPTVVTA